MESKPSQKTSSSNQSIHSVQAEHFHSFNPRISGHTIRCVDAPHAQRANAFDVEIVIVEKEHSFVRDVGDPLQALKVFPLVPGPDFYVIEARGQRRTVVDDEPLHALSSKAWLVGAGCYRGLYRRKVTTTTFIVVRLPLVEFAQAMGCSIEDSDRRSHTIRHDHALPIGGWFLWQLLLLLLDRFGASIVFSLSRLFDPVFHLLEVAQHRRTLDLIHFWSPNTKIWKQNTNARINNLVSIMELFYYCRDL